MGSADESAKLIVGEEAIRFSHLVIDLVDVREILGLLRQILSSSSHAHTSIAVITDVKQRREIVETSPLDLYKFEKERRVLFIFKPLKPSKMLAVFDPQQNYEISTDASQNTVQAAAAVQKSMFDGLRNRFSSRGIRVLVVEDNRTSQQVSIWGCAVCS